MLDACALGRAKNCLLLWSRRAFALVWFRTDFALSVEIQLIFLLLKAESYGGCAHWGYLGWCLDFPPLSTDTAEQIACLTINRNVFNAVSVIWKCAAFSFRTSSNKMVYSNEYVGTFSLFFVCSIPVYLFCFTFLVPIVYCRSAFHSYRFRGAILIK